MRRDLGLDPPERRIGLAAHDFAQGLGAPEVILTRAAKVAGAPTIRSRFTQRIAALAGPQWTEALARGEYYLALARALDAPALVTPAPRPTPVPPPAARPNRLSVTDVENWLRDPYTIYAKHVLRLLPLEPIDAEPGAADRGSVIHEAIGEFARKYTGADLPADPERELIAFGEQSFAAWQDFPEARGFWWPRFLRIARWLAGWERERRATLAAVHGEIRGELTIPLTAGAFTLSARADRIERRKDGSYAILDYKTGQPPTTPQVLSGLAPQLTLEAAILRGGGFEGVPAGPVRELRYLRLKGGEPAVEDKPVKFDKGATPDACAAEALEKLAGVAARFLVEGEPYRSLVHPMWKRHYGDYDHLARVKEWAASGGESEAEQWP
jgi:ATP-dependent helicase/nuclease subunit B